jgi:hypothetical protein
MPLSYLPPSSVSRKEGLMERFFYIESRDDTVIPHRAHDSHSHESFHTGAGAVGVADIIKADFPLVVWLTKDVMITKQS